MFTMNPITFDDIYSTLTSPLPLLLSKAQKVHKQFAKQDIQKCQLLSIKTGSCPENCRYCSQSAHYKTSIEREPLLDVEKVLAMAKKAKTLGAERFCMGAAYRSIPEGKNFTIILDMIRAVHALGLEVCMTLGMATYEQLVEMKKAGLKAYNHNLDTSRAYYPHVVSTRTYDDRLQTIRNARQANVDVCCGGILGLGESYEDRASLIYELAMMDPQPESVPVNLLVPIVGTPFFDTHKEVPFIDMLRFIATTRIYIPRTRIRLSAGRNTLSQKEQEDCFMVGANSIFMGEKLLTTPNVPYEKDHELLHHYQQS